MTTQQSAQAIAMKVAEHLQGAEDQGACPGAGAVPGAGPIVQQDEPLSRTKGSIQPRKELRVHTSRVREEQAVPYQDQQKDIAVNEGQVKDYLSRCANLDQDTNSIRKASSYSEDRKKTMGFFQAQLRTLESKVLDQDRKKYFSRVVPRVLFRSTQAFQQLQLQGYTSTREIKTLLLAIAFKVELSLARGRTLLDQLEPFTSLDLFAKDSEETSNLVRQQIYLMQTLNRSFFQQLFTPTIADYAQLFCKEFQLDCSKSSRLLLALWNSYKTGAFFGKTAEVASVLFHQQCSKKELAALSTDPAEIKQGLQRLFGWDIIGKFNSGFI